MRSAVLRFLQWLIKLIGNEQKVSPPQIPSATPRKHQEQFERVKRWHRRFAEIDKGRIHNLPSDFYQDEVYAFFLNCYHLKDWIRNDSTAGAAAAKVEGFIDATEELRLCADICNSHKHLILTRPRSGQNPQFGRRQFGLHLGESETSINVKYSIETSGGPIDAFELATKCLRAWEAFIASNL